MRGAAGVQKRADEARQDLENQEAQAELKREALAAAALEMRAKDLEAKQKKNREQALRNKTEKKAIARERLTIAAATKLAERRGEQDLVNTRRREAGLAPLAQRPSSPVRSSIPKKSYRGAAPNRLSPSEDLKHFDTPTAADAEFIDLRVDVVHSVYQGSFRGRHASAVTAAAWDVMKATPLPGGSIGLAVRATEGGWGTEIAAPSLNRLLRALRRAYAHAVEHRRMARKPPSLVQAGKTTRIGNKRDPDGGSGPGSGAGSGGSGQGSSGAGSGGQGPNRGAPRKGNGRKSPWKGGQGGKGPHRHNSSGSSDGPRNAVRNDKQARRSWAHSSDEDSDSGTKVEDTRQLVPPLVDVAAPPSRLRNVLRDDTIGRPLSSTVARER